MKTYPKTGIYIKSKLYCMGMTVIIATKYADGAIIMADSLSPYLSEDRTTIGGYDLVDKIFVLNDFVAVGVAGNGVLVEHVPIFIKYVAKEIGDSRDFEYIAKTLLKEAYQVTGKGDNWSVDFTLAGYGTYKNKEKRILILDVPHDGSIVECAEATSNGNRRDLEPMLSVLKSRKRLNKDGALKDANADINILFQVYRELEEDNISQSKSGVMGGNHVASPIKGYLCLPSGLKPHISNLTLEPLVKKGDPLQ